MPALTQASSESQHLKCTRPSTQFAHLISQTHPNPQIPSTRCKSTISSLLSASTETPHPNLRINKKKTSFSAASFRGFGCTAGASRQVSLPVVIRTSADWQETKARKNKHRRSGGENSMSGAVVVDGSVSCVGVQDVWCGPGVGFSADCVIARKNVSARGKTEAEKMTHSHRERFSRSFGTGATTYCRHVPLPLPYPSSHSFAEMMLLQGSLLMGGRLNSHDHFRDWRLDVDNMSYEQLLELGERIGYVNTGLREDEIGRYIRKFKLSKLNERWKHQVDKKCSICQEEYEDDDEVGRLNCAHKYHFECLRQWLALKNCCPVCKHEVVIRHSVVKT